MSAVCRGHVLARSPIGRRLVRIPEQVFRQSHAAAYGGGSLELVAGYDEPGCPLFYEAKYVKGSIPGGDTSWQREYGIAVHEAIAKFEEGATTPEDALKAVWPPGLGVDRFSEAVTDLTRLVERLGTATHTVAAEEDLTCPLYTDPDYGPVRLGGRIDRVAIDGVNPHIIYFDDYKTDRRPPSYKNLERWFQGFWYGALVRANAGRWIADDQVDRVEVVGRYEAVKWYGLNRAFSNDDLDLFMAWAESLARRILRDKKAKPVLNPGCAWCPIRHDCPEWKKLPGIGVGLLERLAKTTLETRVPVMEEAADVRKKLEAQEEDITEALRERILRSGSFEVDGQSWTLADAVRRYADPQAVHRIMGDEFYDAVSVTLGKVDDWIEEHPDRKVEMDRAIGQAPAKAKLKKEPVPEVDA